MDWALPKIEGASSFSSKRLASERQAGEGRVFSVDNTEDTGLGDLDLEFCCKLFEISTTDKEEEASRKDEEISMEDMLSVLEWTLPNLITKLKWIGEGVFWVEEEEHTQRGTHKEEVKQRKECEDRELTWLRREWRCLAGDSGRKWEALRYCADRRNARKILKFLFARARLW